MSSMRRMQHGLLSAPQTVVDVSDYSSYWPMDTANIVWADTSTEIKNLNVAGKDGNSGNMDAGNVIPGNTNEALEFNGIDEHINCGNDTSVLVGTGSFSVVVWKYRHANIANNLRLASKGCRTNDAEQEGFAFWGSDTTVSFAVKNAGEARTIIDSTTSFSTNVWEMVVGVCNRDAGSISIYNGDVLDSSMAIGPGNTDSIHPLEIGATSVPGNFHDGGLCKVAYYKRILSQTDITEILTNGIPQ